MIQRFVGDLSSDIRYALRTLRSSPGFACAAILAIAIGIGINTGIFSVLNGLALRDLPAPESQRLVNVSQLPEGGTERRSHGAPSMFSAAEYERYRASTQTLSGLLAAARPTPVTLGGDAPRQIPGSLVSCNYFDVLQQRPTVGRGFAADTCEAQQAAPEVVLGHDGIRIALGANARQVLALVLRQNGRSIVGGAAIGVLVCVLLAQLLSGLLFGVSTLDPIALGGATVFVLGVALIAALLPARRAMHVDPMTTLRYE